MLARLLDAYRRPTFTTQDHLDSARWNEYNARAAFRDDPTDADTYAWLLSAQADLLDALSKASR
jgi:hypothetical protein